MVFTLAITLITCVKETGDSIGTMDKSMMANGRQEGRTVSGFGGTQRAIATKGSGPMEGSRASAQGSAKTTSTKVSCSTASNTEKESSISKTEITTEAHTSTASPMDLADTSGKTAAIMRGSS